MIYIAGPFFNNKELNVIQRVENILSGRGFEIFSPRLHDTDEYEPQTPEWSRHTFLMDRNAIDQCSHMVMVYHGNYSDTGTAWECGYAHALGKPIVAVHLGESSNLMVHESAIANISIEELENYDFNAMTEIRYSGRMF